MNVKRHAKQTSAGHRWVVDEYINNYAVRHADVAKARGLVHRLARRKTGVAGRGRYRQWTVAMMLRASLLGHSTVLLGFSCSYYWFNF